MHVFHLYSHQRLQLVCLPVLYRGVYETAAPRRDKPALSSLRTLKLRTGGDYETNTPDVAAV